MERRGEIDGRKNGDRDDIQRIDDGRWSLPECVGAVCPQPRLHRRVHHQLQRAVSGAEPVQRLRGETQRGGGGVLFLPCVFFLVQVDFCYFTSAECLSTRFYNTGLDVLDFFLISPSG